MCGFACVISLHKQCVPTSNAPSVGKGFAIFSMIALHYLADYIQAMGGSIDGSYEWIWSGCVTKCMRIV